MTMPSTILRAAILGAFVALSLTGCASERVKAENKKAKANKDEYVDYYPVGSNIPVRVPKNQIRPTESESDTAQQAVRNVQRNGATWPKDPSSGQ